jgi:hypothetical protein
LRKCRRKDQPTNTTHHGSPHSVRSRPSGSSQDRKMDARWHDLVLTRIPRLGDDGTGVFRRRRRDLYGQTKICDRPQDLSARWRGTCRSTLPRHGAGFLSFPLLGLRGSGTASREPREPLSNRISRRIAEARLRRVASEAALPERYVTDGGGLSWPATRASCVDPASRVEVQEEGPGRAA